MSFSRDNYLDLLARYSQQPGAVEKIACEWLVENKISWKPWIPTSDEKNVIYIGGIFPISGSTYTGKGIVRGEELVPTSLMYQTQFSQMILCLLHHDNINNIWCGENFIMQFYKTVSS